MNFQNNKYTLRFANESDNEGIREIFESESFRGNLDVKFLRNPQPYESFCKDGDEARILIIVDNERKKIVAVGGAVIREEYISGKAEKCAYLTGLKIHPKYRKKIFFIAKAYEFLRQSLEDCSFCYTTILNSNQTAIAMFEKQHKNMPHYKYLGQYTTYCFHGGKQKLEVEKNNLTGFEEVLKKYFSKINCTPCNWNYGGFGQKDFYCVRRDNEIIACCFVGNQQGTKQYKMCSYGGIYKFLSHLPTQLMGYPKFPPENCLINHGVVSYLFIKENDKKLCKDFLRTVAAVSEYSLLLWGGFENNPLTDVVNNLKTVHYGSRVYSVDWGEEISISDIIGIEVALL